MNQADVQIEKPLFSSKLQIKGQYLCGFELGPKKTFILCVRKFKFSSSYYMLQIDSQGNSLKRLKIPTTYPSSKMVSPYEVLICGKSNKDQQKLALLLWNLKTDKSTETFLDFKGGYFRFFYFKQSGFICIVLLKPGNTFLLTIFKLEKGVLKKAFETVFEHPEKKKEVKIRQINQTNELCFFQQKFQANSSILQLHKLTLSENRLPTKVTLHLKFLPLSFEWTNRKITDIWSPTKSLLYFQAAVIVNEVLFICSKDRKNSFIDQQDAAKFELYEDYLMDLQTQTISKIQDPKIESKNHRLQFSNSLRQIYLFQQEGMTFQQRFRQKLFPTGVSSKYFFFKNDVPIYYFDLFSRRVVGKCPENISSYSVFIWPLWNSHLFCYLKFQGYQQQQGLSVTIWKTKLVMREMGNIYSTFFLQSLISDCDEELLQTVRQLVDEDSCQQPQYVEYSQS